MLVALELALHMGGVGHQLTPGDVLGEWSWPLAQTLPSPGAACGCGLLLGKVARGFDVRNTLACIKFDNLMV